MQLNVVHLVCLTEQANRLVQGLLGHEQHLEVDLAHPGQLGGPPSANLRKAHQLEAEGYLVGHLEGQLETDTNGHLEHALDQAVVLHLDGLAAVGAHLHPTVVHTGR